MDAPSNPKRGTKRAAELSIAEKASKLLKLMSKKDNEKKDRLFRLFIEFAQEGYYKCSLTESQQFKCWISSSKINVNNKDWTQKYERTVDTMNWGKPNKEPILLAHILKDLLPILFECNDDVNYVDKTGRTILHVFVEICYNNFHLRGYEKSLKVPHFAKRLIDMGASVNLTDKQGLTPLHIAAKKRHEELMKVMLKDFTNVHSCDEDGNTILHYVIEKFIDVFNTERLPIEGFGFVVCELLTKGADVYRKNKAGMTPLHVAAKYSFHEILDVFLKCGVDVNSRTNDGDTPLLLICKNLSMHSDDGMKGNAIELLLERGCDSNVADKDGYSALHFLARYHETIVKMVIELGRTDVRCRTREFKLTPLHLANCVEMIDVLVEAGADVDAETVNGATPLFTVAVRLADLKMMKRLVELGADVKVRDKLFGFTVLHLSALCGAENKVEFMLRQDLNVDDGGKFGITPLHLASLAGRLDVVKMLIERGANVNCRDKVTRSMPLHFASMKVDQDSVDKLINRIVAGKCGGSIGKCWRVPRLRSRRYDEVIEFLVESGANVKIKNSNGQPALRK